VQFGHLSSKSDFICCVGIVPFQRIDLSTLVTSWLGYFSFASSLVFGGNFGTAAKYFERNLRLPFTPPLVTVSGPSDVDCEGESENRRIRLRETAVDHS